MRCGCSVHNMEILIIGGTRFFGIPMTERLLQEGHSITIATRGSRCNPFGDRVRHILCDKTDGESVRQKLGAAHYDLVIDKVAYASNDVRSLLGNIRCDRYMQMSSCAVYKESGLQIPEHAFDPAAHPLIWMDRPADYAEGKRQAERAALEFMPADACTFVRYPVVLGPHDYTGRLRFYAEHVAAKMPMRVQNPDAEASYIHEKEAGEFLAYLAEHPCAGAVNGCASGTVSQRKILWYMEQVTGHSAILSEAGDPAPYDGSAGDCSYDTAKAAALGCRFSDLHTWLPALAELEISQTRGTL